MNNRASISMSQGYEVLQPRSGQALPVPCAEWDLLKTDIRDATTEPWLFHTCGSVLIGASLATVISLFTGAVVSSETLPNAKAVALSAAIVCGLTGFACWFFAQKESGLHRKKASHVLSQMQLIESRFDRSIA